MAGENSEKDVTSKMKRRWKLVPVEGHFNMSLLGARALADHQ